MLVHERAQAVFLEPGDLACNQLHPGNIRHIAVRAARANRG